MTLNISSFADMLHTAVAYITEIIIMLNALRSVSEFLKAWNA